MRLPKDAHATAGRTFIKFLSLQTDSKNPDVSRPFVKRSDRWIFFGKSTTFIIEYSTAPILSLQKIPFRRFTRM